MKRQHYDKWRSLKVLRKLFESAIQLHLVNCVPYASVLRRGASSSLLVVNFVWQLWLSPQCFKAGKVLASCSTCSSWQMNRQFCNFMKSWNFRVPNFLKSPLTASIRFLKQFFLTARFYKTWIEFWFAKFVYPHSCAP